MSAIASILGLFVSVVGLILTIVVYVKVKNLQEDYLFRGRVPVLVGELRQHATNLADYHRESASSRNLIEAELSRVRSTVKALEMKLGRSERASVTRLSERVNGFNTGMGKEALWAIYVQMQEVIEDVKNVQEDRSWNRQ